MSLLPASGLRRAEPGSSPEASEARLAALARARAPLRRVLAALARRLAERRAFEPLGFARLGDYARERLGISARSVQELARVDRRLDALPRLEAALVSGALPWSKVRLLARFVSPNDEAHFIARAAGASVRELERELREVSRGALGASAGAGALGTDALETDEEGACEEATEVVAVGASLALRFKWQRTCRYATRICGETTPPGTVLEWVTAEALAALPGAVEGEVAADVAVAAGLYAAPEALRESASSKVGVASVCASHALAGKAPRLGGNDPRLRGNEPLPAGSDPRRDGNAPAEETLSPAPAALPLFLRPLLAGLEDADAFELDARLRRVLRLEQRLEAEIAPLLRRVMSREYEWTGPRPTLASYARDVLGMSPRKARALLRIERAGDVCPELRRSWRDGAISWVQAQELARLVEPGEVDHGFLRAWVAWAPEVTVRRLAEDVEEALLLREADPQAWAAVREHPERVGRVRGEDGLGEGPGPADAERQTCAPPSALDAVGPIRVRAPREMVRLFRRVLCSVRLGLEGELGRLPSEAEAFDALLDHALRAWDVGDRWLKRSSCRRQYAIFARDGWRCVVPGCTSRRNLHAHHIVFRSAGGSDALENLTTLCAFHHQRGVHAGRVRVTGTAPEGLGFELGTREGQPPLARYRAGDIRA